MKNFKFIILLCFLAATFFCNAQTSEQDIQSQRDAKIIKDYYAGWVKKDWNAVSALLADGFTFTSPAPDDHIPIEKFKEKCWPQAQHIQRFEFVKIIGNERKAFAIMHVITTDSKVIRNVEYFNFNNGKIKSIEVFFGGTGQGYPTNKK